MSSAIFTEGQHSHDKVLTENGHAVPHVEPVIPSNYFRWKNWIDFFLAAILLVPGVPLMAILICLVRLTSRGPAIYSQRRVGKKGRIFKMYKLRSMRHNAEAKIGPTWAQTADPRVTFIGHYLRKFHLDELPQLFNVLRGEMSLIGPRPERPEFVEILSRQIPEYANRLAVKPGITGLAQLNLPPDSDLESVRRKVVLDLEYVQAAGVWFDMKLIFCTAMRFTKLPVLGFFGLYRAVNLLITEPETTSSKLPDSLVTLHQFRRQIETKSTNGKSVGAVNAIHYNYYKCKQSQPLFVTNSLVKLSIFKALDDIDEDRQESQSVGI